jgi:hypothetical protein
MGHGAWGSYLLHVILDKFFNLSQSQAKSFWLEEKNNVIKKKVFFILFCNVLSKE